jgi:hypothetical protein
MRLDTHLQIPSQKKLQRLAAAIIILLTTNIAAMLFPRTLLAQPLNMASQTTAPQSIALPGADPN